MTHPEQSWRWNNLTGPVSLSGNHQAGATVIFITLQGVRDGEVLTREAIPDRKNMSRAGTPFFLPSLCNRLLGGLGKVS